MVAPEHCPACGCELLPDSPAGLCPDCLLKQGLDGPHDQPEVDGDVFAVTTPQPGAFRPPEPGKLAPHFPHLEIQRLLGHGGMGAVYVARQTKLDRLVALKIIRPESAGDPAFAERFNREARTLARLNHPNIVGVHDFGEVTFQDSGTGQDATLYYFLMEYVDGANLRELMESGQLRPEQALAIVPQVCDSLQFAHNEGIVHRDIKPENILVDTRGRVKIADFGLARLVENSPADVTLTGTHQVMGTPRYMAPEQMEGSHAVDHRADIYSLGVVFYEMLTGEVPMGQFEPPSKKAAVHVGLDQVVMRALAREPERRYQQASEMSQHVNAIGANTPPPEPVTDADDVVPRPGPSTVIEQGIGGVVEAARRLVSPGTNSGDSENAEQAPVARRPEPSARSGSGHVTALGVIHIAFGSLGLLVALIVFVSVTGGGVISQDPVAMRVTGIVGTSVAALFAIFSLPGIIVGFGLLRLRQWARILALILAVLNIANVPFGTILSVYTGWILLFHEESVALFADAGR